MPCHGRRKGKAERARLIKSMSKQARKLVQATTAADGSSFDITLHTDWVWGPKISNAKQSILRTRLLSFSADAHLELSPHSLDDSSRKGQPQKKRLCGSERYGYRQWKKVKGKQTKKRMRRKGKNPDPGVRDLDGAGQLDQQPDDELDRPQTEAAPLPSSISQWAFYFSVCLLVGLSCRSKERKKKKRRTAANKQEMLLAAQWLALRLVCRGWSERTSCGCSRKWAHTRLCLPRKLR